MDETSSESSLVKLIFISIAVGAIAGFGALLFF